MTGAKLLLVEDIVRRVFERCIFRVTRPKRDRVLFTSAPDSIFPKHISEA